MSTFSNTQFIDIFATSFRVKFLEVHEYIILYRRIISLKIRKVVGCKQKPEFQGLFKT